MGKDTAVVAKKKGGKLRDTVVSLTGNELERSLVKVTSRKIKPVSAKHMRRLLDAAQTDPEHITGWIVGELERRLHNHEWAVVAKTLFVLHTLLKQGPVLMADRIARKEGLFHISHFKDLTEHSRFVKKYSRYLEERCMAMLHMGCGLSIERHQEVMQELDRMPPSRALKATKCLAIQLGVLVGLELATPGSVDWTGNVILTEALLLLISDSRVLFTILTVRTKWLLDNAQVLSPEDREVALEVFLQYTDYSSKLVDMFAELRKHSSVASAVPTLTPLPKDRIVLLTQYLEGSALDAAPVPLDIHVESLQDQLGNTQQAQGVPATSTVPCPPAPATVTPPP